MTTRLKIVLGLVAICAVVMLGFVPLIHDPRPQIAAHAEVERVISDAEDANAAELRRLYTKLVYLRDGDAAGDLYVRCTEEPPRQPANISKCKTLLDRLQREDAKTAAAEAKKKAEW